MECMTCGMRLHLGLARSYYYQGKRQRRKSVGRCVHSMAILLSRCSICGPVFLPVACVYLLKFPDIRATLFALTFSIRFGRVFVSEYTLP